MPSLNVEGTVGQVGQDGQLGHSKDDAEKEISYSSYCDDKVDGLALIFLRIPDTSPFYNLHPPPFISHLP